MQVGTTDAAVGDLNIDVVLRPLLGLKCAPFHLSVDRIRAVAQPALELVVGGHDCLVCSRVFRAVEIL